MKPLSENRRALFDYAILEHFDAGIELTGHEVKSVKAGHASLAGAYAIIRGGEIFLINCQIPPYQQNNAPEDYESSRTRRLLLHKEEIGSLAGKLKTKGLSLLALSFFLKKNLVKVDLGLGRSRKAHDKRELLKKRATDREVERTLGTGS
jgi:SsrA-binding protein